MSKRTYQTVYDITNDFNHTMLYITDSTIHPALRLQRIADDLPKYENQRDLLIYADPVIHLIWEQKINRLENYREALKFCITLDAILCPL